MLVCTLGNFLGAFLYGAAAAVVIGAIVAIAVTRMK